MGQSTSEHLSECATLNHETSPLNLKIALGAYLRPPPPISRHLRGSILLMCRPYCSRDELLVTDLMATLS